MFSAVLQTCEFDPESGVSETPVQPRPCPPGEFYPFTRGYRKIPGDSCVGGDEHMYSPIMYACQVQGNEFLFCSNVFSKIILKNSFDVNVF